MGLRIMTQQKAAEGPEPLGQPHTCLFLLAWHIRSLPYFYAEERTSLTGQLTLV